MRKREIRLLLAHMIVLFLVNVWVAWPYIALDYSAHSWGNDFGYISVARLFREDAWTWNALQYCGAPFRYLYPPLFHAAVALVPLSLGRAFHICGGVAYALIPVCMYYLIIQLGRSTHAGLFAGIAYSLVASPIYLLLPFSRASAMNLGFAPVNLIGLTRYDEAPHFLAFAIGLLAIAFAWRKQLRLASCLGAAVLLTNVPGAIAFLMLLVAFGLAKREFRISVGLGLMTFALSAFWITPGYGAVVAQTNRVLSSSQTGENLWTAEAVAIAGTAVLVTLVISMARWTAEIKFALIWIAIAGGVVTLSALCGISVLPLANRYALEWNAALVLGVTVLLFSGPQQWRFLAVALLCLGAWFARGFLAHPWKWQVEREEAHDIIAFQASSWLETHTHGARTFASGEVENSLDAWGQDQQTGGSFTGMSNLVVVAAAKQIQGACQPLSIEKQLAFLWLQALDARYVIVNEAESKEGYHWMAHPEIFSDLQNVWTNGRGDRIVAVPENGANAVVVDLGALERLPRFTSIANLSFLSAYVSWAHGLRNANLTWSRTDTGHLRTKLAPGEGILVKTSFDPGWSSSLGKVESDPIGFLLIRPANPNPENVLKFRAAWDVWLGILITIVGALALPWMRSWPWVGGAAVLVWGLSFWVLAHQLEPKVRIAAEEFRINRLPLISLGGIVDSAQGSTGKRLISIYGENFGDRRAHVRVLLGGRYATVLSRATNLITVESPVGIKDTTRVSVEVDGCQGNSFLLH